MYVYLGVLMNIVQSKDNQDYAIKNQKEQKKGLDELKINFHELTESTSTPF